MSRSYTSSPPSAFRTALPFTFAVRNKHHVFGNFLSRRPTRWVFCRYLHGIWLRSLLSYRGRSKYFTDTKQTVSQNIRLMINYKFNKSILNRDSVRRVAFSVPCISPGCCMQTLLHSKPSLFITLQEEKNTVF
jgi:hypothetical protein